VRDEREIRQVPHAGSAVQTYVAPITSVLHEDEGARLVTHSDSSDNRDIVRRFVDEVISRGELDRLDQLLTADYAYHAPGMEVRGPDAMKHVFGALRGGFPDWSETIEELVAEGDRVVFRVTGRGTHRGEFMGIPPTGREVSVAGVDIVRLTGDRIAEHWAVFDQFGMLQQLGFAPRPA